MSKITDKIDFLVDPKIGVKFHKFMFIKRGGKALTSNGNDLSRNILDAELICVTNEDENNWIGNYAEGIGFFGVRFAKSDCRDASEEEIEEYFKNQETFKY